MNNVEKCRADFIDYFNLPKDAIIKTTMFKYKVTKVKI